MLSFISKTKYYVYVPNSKRGIFVVKAIFNSEETADKFARINDGFVQEVEEEWGG